MSNQFQKVVTYTSPREQSLKICPQCEQEFRAKGEWPKDVFGCEYVNVSFGLHVEPCEVCEAKANGEMEFRGVKLAATK